MQNDIVLTCAVTGAGDTTGKSAHVPVSPKDIAKAADDGEIPDADAIFTPSEASKYWLEWLKRLESES